MQYKDFVREMFAKHKGKMPAKQIMKLAAQEWASVRDGKKKMPKSKSVKGKGITAGGITGGSILDDIGDVLGFGLDKKKKMRKPRQQRKKRDEKGSGLFGDLSGVLNTISSVVDPLVSIASGHGLQKNKQMKKVKAAGITGGAMEQKPKKLNKIPKETNPLSTFYQFDNLPASNFAMSQPNPPRGGMIMLDDDKKMVRGAGFFDNIMPLLPFALL